MSAIKHGTYGGAQKCVKRAEGTCDECRAARAAYIREYRASHVEGQKWEKAKSNARLRALWKLAGQHDAEFRALVAEEMRGA